MLILNFTQEFILLTSIFPFSTIFIGRNAYHLCLSVYLDATLTTNYQFILQRRRIDDITQMLRTYLYGHIQI